MLNPLTQHPQAGQSRNDDDDAEDADDAGVDDAGDAGGDDADDAGDDDATF